MERRIKSNSRLLALLLAGLFCCLLPCAYAQSQKGLDHGKGHEKKPPKPPKGGPPPVPDPPPPPPVPPPPTSTYFAGVNYPWWNFGSDFGTGPWGKFTNWAAIDADFAAMQTQGVKHAAWAMFTDGRYSPDFNADGTCFLDAQVLPDLDTAMSIASSHGIDLKLDLIYAGGMFGGYNYNFGAPAGGHAGMVTDPVQRQSYFDNVLAPLAAHINSSPLKATIKIIDLVDEPELAMVGFAGYTVEGWQMQEFVRLGAIVVHAQCPGILVTVDASTPYWVWPWQGQGLDLYSLHYYPWMDFGNGPGSGLPPYASLGLDKPCIVGEYATNDTDYIIGSTQVQSAQWYLDTIPALGYAGSYAWSFTKLDGSADNWLAFQPVYSNWIKTH